MKKNPPDLTKRNLNILNRRVTKLEQAIVLLHGDINKINRQLQKR